MNDKLLNIINRNLTAGFLLIILMLFWLSLVGLFIISEIDPTL